MFQKSKHSKPQKNDLYLEVIAKKCVTLFFLHEVVDNGRDNVEEQRTNGPD